MAQKLTTAIKSRLKKILGVAPAYSLIEANIEKNNLNKTFNHILALNPRVTHPAEYIALSTLAAITRFNIIEVGAYLGYSSCIMASAISGERIIISIDPFDREKGWQNGTSDDHIYKKYSQYEWAQKTIVELGFSDKIKLNRNNSELAYLELKDKADNNFDLIFIDGDHHFQPCFNDLINYSSLLLVNGFLVAHDYICDKHPGVKEAVDKFLDENKNFEALYIVQSMIILQRNA